MAHLTPPRGGRLSTLATGGPISKVRAWLSNLRLRFLLLVLLAVLPAVALLLFTVSEQRDVAVQKGQANAQQLAGLATADQGRLIESTRQLLTVLALLPEVQTGGTACNELFATLLTQFPLYANLGVIGLDGMVTCSGIPTLWPRRSERPDLFPASSRDQGVRRRRIPDRPHHRVSRRSIAAIRCLMPTAM